jgi:cbb3-type cytochrome oxidase maturation protein
MTVVPVLVLLSLFLGLCGVLLFLHGMRNRDHEHADRLALLPLEEDLSGAKEEFEDRVG